MHSLDRLSSAAWLGDGAPMTRRSSLVGDELQIDVLGEEIKRTRYELAVPGEKFRTLLWECPLRSHTGMVKGTRRTVTTILGWKPADEGRTYRHPRRGLPSQPNRRSRTWTAATPSAPMCR